MPVTAVGTREAKGNPCFSARGTGAEVSDYGKLCSSFHEQRYHNFRSQFNNRYNVVHYNFVLELGGGRLEYKSIMNKPLIF